MNAPTALHRRSASRPIPATRLRRGQRGVVLFVALMAVVVLALAALALLRSTDTAGVVAGNLAFKEATTHAADSGVERAFNALPALATGNVDVANQYFRLMQAVDSYGVPSTINWANVPCYDTAGGATAISCTDQSLYRVQYVIDRLCTVAPVAGDTLTQLTGKCVAGQAFSSGGGASDDNTSSHAQTTGIFGSLAPPPPNPPTIHYRVTVRVLGPRNTSSIVQATIELPYS